MHTLADKKKTTRQHSDGANNQLRLLNELQVPAQTGAVLFQRAGY